MKFAKELEADLVPEWRIKYLDYKAGKRKVKSVTKALNKVRSSGGANGIPPTPRSIFTRTRNSPAVGSLLSRPSFPNTPRTPFNGRTPSSFGRPTDPHAQASSGALGNAAKRRNEDGILSPKGTAKELGKSPAAADGANGKTASTPRARPSGRVGRMEEGVDTFDAVLTPLPLELPEPALPDSAMPPQDSLDSTPTVSRGDSQTGLLAKVKRGDSGNNTQQRQRAGRIHFDSSAVERPANTRRVMTNPGMTPSGFSLRSQHSAFSTSSSERRDRPLIRRLWSDTMHLRHRHHRGGSSANVSSVASTSTPDWNPTALRELDEKEADFFAWLQGQLDMVETFYREKEEEAVERLEVLKAQLGRMRDLRSREVEKARAKKRRAIQRAKKLQELEEQAERNGGTSGVISGVESNGNGNDDNGMGWLHDVNRTISETVSQAQPQYGADPLGTKKPWYAPIERRFNFGTYRFGGNTEAMARMGPSGYNYGDELEEVQEGDESEHDSADPDSDGSSASERGSRSPSSQQNGSKTGSPKIKSNGNSSDTTVKGASSVNGKVTKISGTPPNGEEGDDSTAGDSSNQQQTNNNKTDKRRDFVRRAKRDEKVPYDRAKRQLKLALQEFYRGLELLKSYALLNRTAFRKINKKYDKAVDARPTLRFFSEKVNGGAYFVQSGVLDQAMVAVEDLYARYFARGNRKVAVNKLRSRTKTPGQDETGATFRTGLWLAAGSVLAIEGLAWGLTISLDSSYRTKHEQASFLLQLYAGYFLAIMLFLGFVVDAGLWTRSKVNYVFVFEFDTRHNLDWKQLAELPSMLYFLMGLFMFLNFIPYTPDDWFIWWPVWLIGLTVLIIFLPLPVLYHKSRQWFVVANFRLLLAGFFPVEFRDFFLGDMFCSLTYSMGNIEIFFCLYAHLWAFPDQCNSNHSRLLGFFSTLPGIWRALQCIRRYMDTRNAFPHLANCGKYLCTILYYMTLSLFRIDRAEPYFIAFVFFSTLNAIYVSIWDVFMDWSLGDAKAPNRFLRRELGFKNAWIYYAAMAIDPIIRFNWVFYAIFRHDVQHSAALAFFVSFTEALRRIMWTLFRVENEHCTNVGRFRASRDVSLPYSLPSDFQHRHSIVSAAGSASPATEEGHAPPQQLQLQGPHKVTSPIYSPTSPPTGKLQEELQFQPKSPQQAAAGAAGSRKRHQPSFGAHTGDAGAGGSTAIDIEAGTGRPGIMRRRTDAHSTSGQHGIMAGSSSPIQRGLQRFGTAISTAHAQDFERKRKPDAISGRRASEGAFQQQERSRSRSRSTGAHGASAAASSVPGGPGILSRAGSSGAALTGVGGDRVRWRDELLRMGGGDDRDRTSGNVFVDSESDDEDEDEEDDEDEETLEVVEELLRQEEEEEEAADETEQLDRAEAEDAATKVTEEREEDERLVDRLDRRDVHREMLEDERAQADAERREEEEQEREQQTQKDAKEGR